MDVAVAAVKQGLAELGVVSQQGVQGAAVGVQQAGAGDVGALLGGDEVDFGGDEGGARLCRHAQGVEGFGEDLRRQAGGGEEDAAGVGHGRALSLSFHRRR